MISAWLYHVAASTDDAKYDTDVENARSGTGALKRHKKMCPRAGFDGHYSSTDDTQLLFPSDALGGPSCPSTHRPREVKSDVSGSIDWEKSWPKRNPRRVHNVSEASNPDVFRHTHEVDFFSMMTHSEDSDDSRDNVSCPDIMAHDSRFHAIHQYALKSCPDLHRQLDGFVPFRTTLDGDQPAALPEYSEFDRYRHRYHLHFPRRITRRFRSFGRRLRGSSSSTYSIRSEFPAPLVGKERRVLARDSTDIWPSSSDESPVFNTPESNPSPVQPGGSHVNTLAMSGMMIATAELDRLSGSVSQDQMSRVSESPMSQTPVSSGLASSGTSTSISGSTVTNVPSNIPFNTPSSPGPQSGIPSPATRPPLRPGHRRRAQRSRLSEVTTPEDVALPAEPIDDRVHYQSIFSPSNMEILPDRLPGSANEGHESLYPKPLSISRNSPDRVESPPDNRREKFRDSTPGLASLASGHISIRYYDDRPLFPASDSVLTPTRTSSIGKTPNSIHARDKTDGQGGAEKLWQSTANIGLRPVSRSSTGSPGPRQLLGIPVESPGAVEPRSYTTVSHRYRDPLPPESSSHHIGMDVGDTILGDAHSGSCHPDTWTESQGEPGNAEPFCPSECLETRHSSQADQPQPSTTSKGS
ncbi:hypothetical protein F4775DRAFT_387642 [Biscogniauxia sp. FL1348]|nr:hypothetical protein F4775DRAFT_387642 [Biscogniauxia sp. FL1348]